jgi:hypothetical protein
MNNNNPKLALDAILDTPQLIGALTVYPITVARMALLELVDSPFLNPKRKFTIANMTESAFIMCADSSELKGFTSRNVDALIDKAYQWAEHVDINAIPEVIKNVLEKLARMYKVSPTTGNDEGESDSKN